MISSLFGNKCFLRWWIFISLHLAAIFPIVHYDVFNRLMVADKSKISLLIIFLFISATMIIGKKSYQRYSEIFYTKSVWDVTQACIGLGLIGTVVGFIMTLDGAAFDKLDTANMESARLVLKQMINGMGTALWTTLVGYVASMSLKSQLSNYENFDNEAKFSPDDMFFADEDAEEGNL